MVGGWGGETSDVYGVGADSREIKEHPRVAINYVHLNYKLQVEKKYFFVNTK